MALDDLSSHDSEVITPISTDYKVKSVTLDGVYLYFDNMLSRGNDSIVCSGCASMGASPQHSGLGCPAAAQHPGGLSSQRYANH